jgi:hypothetical protein
MATWPKEDVCEMFIVSSGVNKGSKDTSSHTVLLRPVDGTADITCSQWTNDLSIWGPNSDLDDEKTYDWYVDGTIKKRLPARKALAGVQV